MQQVISRFCWIIHHVPAQPTIGQRLLMVLPTPLPRSSRPVTIGVLTAWLNGPTEINLWHGVADRALERNVNLICFSGGIPHWHEQYEAQKNILFNIPNRENVDGLLIWANILSHTLEWTGRVTRNKN
jgi:hypothetical protein